MAGDVSAMERAKKFFESWVYHRNNINKVINLQVCHDWLIESVFLIWSFSLKSSHPFVMNL